MMTRLFISHSSKDDTEVTKVSDWLSVEGFDDHFVDHIHIPAGISWNQELPIQVNKAEIFVLYVTQSWLSSSECFSEYRSAYYGNKVIIPLLVTDQLWDLKGEENKRFQALCSSVQGVSIKGFPPDEVTSKLLIGSLTLSSNNIKWAKQKKLVKRISLTVGSFVFILMLIAAYFRDSIGAHIEKRAISKTFKIKTTKEFEELFSDVEVKPVEERKFMECESDAVCPKMIVLPAGSYIMGYSNIDAPEPNHTESPRKKIEIPQFAVSINEITQSQWSKCFLSTRLEKPKGCKEIFDIKKTPQHPVDLVSWQDTKTYINWLNQQVAGTVNGPYRLLSEAEWEYAARGITSIKEDHKFYPWGDEEEDACDYANALDLNMPESLACGRIGINCPNNLSVLATPVGIFKSNKFGLKDISGNLAEWVEDCWHGSYHGRPTDSSSWINSTDKNCERVIRGGSWAGKIDHLRSAARTKLNGDLYGFNIGFRIARDLDWTAND